MQLQIVEVHTTRTQVQAVHTTRPILQITIDWSWRVAHGHDGDCSRTTFPAQIMLKGAGSVLASAKMVPDMTLMEKTLLKQKLEERDAEADRPSLFAQFIAATVTEGPRDSCGSFAMISERLPGRSLTSLLDKGLVRKKCLRSRLHWCVDLFTAFAHEAVANERFHVFTTDDILVSETEDLKYWEEELRTCGGLDKRGAPPEVESSMAATLSSLAVVTTAILCGKRASKPEHLVEQLGPHLHLLKTCVARILCGEDIDHAEALKSLGAALSTHLVEAAAGAAR